MKSCENCKEKVHDKDIQIWEDVKPDPLYRAVPYHKELCSACFDRWGYLRERAVADAENPIFWKL